MLLFSLALCKHKLTFIKLSECMKHLPLAATWAEGEWGYIRNKGVEYRKKVLDSLKENVYIGTFAGKPVAMFVLLNYELHPDLRNARDRLAKIRELMYVYVDKEYRGLGFGRQIIDEAKIRAKAVDANLILLDTLKPGLNRMYKNQGAEVLCENHLFSHPTEVLTIKL